MVNTAPTPTPSKGPIGTMLFDIRRTMFGDGDDEPYDDIEVAEAAYWYAEYEARRAEEEAAKPKRITEGTIPSIRTALTRLSRTSGEQFIDHRGMAWTAVGPENPGVWSNARGIYRDTLTLATRIAREGK